jgi:hypothetical protein
MIKSPDFISLANGIQVSKKKLPYSNGYLVADVVVTGKGPKKVFKKRSCGQVKGFM